MTVLAQCLTAEGRTKADPDENHLYCCNPDVSLCGLDITDTNEQDFADEECCPICRDLSGLPCRPGCRGDEGGEVL